MKISKQARRDARQLFRACLNNGVLDEARARKAAEVVVKDKPRGYFAILNQFHHLVKLEIDRRTAKVESANALTPQYQSQLQADLTKRYGTGLNFVFVQNPALLGGIRIQVGGDVYNNSVAGRLAALQESF
jgi:F-type H+-transporting ATPase subunit delta